MKRKILIEKKEKKIWTFLLENDSITEIHCTPENDEKARYQIGDIYIGKVQNIVANIGAAFIEIAPGVNCYFDLQGVPTALFTYKIGKKPLCIGDELLVQISREAVKTKAPTVTGNLNLTGRYAVLTHGNTRIGVSSKIPKKERDAYKLRLQAYQNDRFGIIVRTNAKEAPFEAVVKEIEDLKKEYERLTSNAMSRVCFSCLKSAPPSYITDLKNAYMDGMQEIIVDDTPVTLFMGEDEQRPLAERVARFLPRVNGNYTIIDTKEFELKGISPEYRGTISHLVMHGVNNRVDAYMELFLRHPLSIRRYYRQFEY